MSTEEELDDAGAGTLEPGVRAADQALGQSILDRVKQKREERVDDESLILDIPSWDGELKARFEVVDRKVLEKMVRRMRLDAADKKNQANVADVDFLIKACVEVRAYDSDTDEEASVSDGFNRELADRLGNPPGTQDDRGLVLYLTGIREADGTVKPNGIAIGSLAIKVARWMQDPSRKPLSEDPQ